MQKSFAIEDKLFFTPLLLFQYDVKLADLQSDLTTMANMIEKNSDIAILQASQFNQSLTNLTISMHWSIERIEIRNQLQRITNDNLSKSLTHQLEARLRDVNQNIETELKYYRLLTEIKFANLTSVMDAITTKHPYGKANMFCLSWARQQQAQ